MNPVPALRPLAAACALVLLHGAGHAQLYNPAQTFVSTLARSKAITSASNVLTSGSYTIASQSHDSQSQQLERVSNFSSTHQAGYGNSDGGSAYADANASAEPGAVRAFASASGEARANPDFFAGAQGFAQALGVVSDRVVFSAPALHPGALIIVGGTLNLSGTFDGMKGGFSRIEVTASGLDPQHASARFTIECFAGNPTCRQQDAQGQIGSWTSGQPLVIPFEFTAINQQAAPVEFTLLVTATGGAEYPPCEHNGGICTGAQFGTSSATVDFTHTLAWGGAHVTDQNGRAQAFTAFGLSGFDYAQPFVPSVPEPGTAALWAAGALALLRVVRRKSA